MLDIGFIRANREQVAEAAEQKGIHISIPLLLDADERRRSLLRSVEALRRERNGLTERVSVFLRAGRLHDAESQKARTRLLNSELAGLERKLTAAEDEFRRMMLLVPNVVSADTPVGASDADNVLVREMGQPPLFGFAPRDHVELGELHGLFDLRRGVKVGGSRSYFLKGAGLRLHRAVQQLALDLLEERGFTVMDVPMLVREEVLVQSGFFPHGMEQTYAFERDGKWLAGTSEAPLVAYYADEIVDVSVPIRLAAVSSCYRREAGSAGRDVRGLYRVHQFAKVEQVVLCGADPDIAEALLQDITSNAEALLGLLEIPYRVMAVCTGDMSAKTYKQYDLEAWMPGRCSFGETHSSSNLCDYQARRANIRYRDADGKLRFCHTLNNTAVASPRILIPLLENHQREDGSVAIPAALRRYMNGLEALRIPEAD